MLKYISQLKTIDSNLLHLLYEEVQTTHINWFESFSEYQSGGWKIASLYNATGDETYDVPHESNIKPTLLLKRMPKMQAFLDSTGLDYMMARLTCSNADSHLYEHVDYAGLEKREKLRLHIPLYTHTKALMSLNDKNIYLKAGFMWKLDPREGVHGVSNSGTKPRIHLLLDCYMNPVLESLIQQEWLDDESVIDRPLLTQQVLAQRMKHASHLLAQSQQKAAEHFLLTTFYLYQYPANTTGYDLVLDLYQHHNPHSPRIAYWEQRMEEVYGILTTA